MKLVKQFLDRIKNVKLNIRSHLAEHDDFLFSHQNLYRFHLPVDLSNRMWMICRAGTISPSFALIIRNRRKHVERQRKHWKWKSNSRKPTKIKAQFNKCRSKGEKFSSWNPYSDQGISDEFYTNELVEPDNKKPSMDEIAGVWDEENENPTPHPWEK